MVTKKQAETEFAKGALLSMLVPGDTIHYVVRNVSRSGMSRQIDFYRLSADGPLYLSGYFATVGGYSRAKSGALKVSGCGMDMGFYVTYNVSSALWPSGFACGGQNDGRATRCPGSDHSNGVKTAHHKDGGYALRSASL